jgi:hypothetical protein
MPSPFAALESRLNSAVFNRLSNVSTTLGGSEVQGIFDNEYDLAGVGLSGMSSSAPAFRLASHLVPANPVGLPLVIGVSNYAVVEHLPDGSGLSVLLLERTA